MAKAARGAAILEHIRRLIEGKHRLLERSHLTDGDARRLGAIQVELDRCWDLLRQRRALREFSGDPSQAHARDVAA